MGFILNPYRYAAVGGGLLLDEAGLGSAHAAYSVARKLRNAYAGNCIRVRRTSDSTEQNIGFSSNVLDTSSLETFCSGTDGYVVTIYDQSGNSYDIGQTTTTKQPKIVSSGTTITVGGKPAMQLDSNDVMLTTTITISSYNAVSLMAVYDMDAANRGDYIKHVLAIADSNTPFTIRSGRYTNAAEANKQGVTGTSSATAALSSAANTSQLIGVGFVNSTALSWYENNNSEVTGSTAEQNFTSANVYIGSKTLDGFPFNGGTIQECVVWVTDLEASVATIKSNVNAFYSIY